MTILCLKWPLHALFYIQNKVFLEEFKFKEKKG